MKKKFIINGVVTYIPEQNLLIPLNKKGVESVLNLPASLCLRILLENPNTLITKKFFFEKVWVERGQQVTTNTLYQNISLLRKSLELAGIDPKVIKTIPKEGVKFVGEVQFILIEGNESYSPANNIQTKNILPDEVVTAKTATAATLSKINIKRKKIFFTLSLFSFIVVIFILIIILTPITITLKRDGFFSEHAKLFTFNQCVVYTKKNDVNMNNSEVIDFLNLNNTNCKSNEFIYVTNSLGLGLDGLAKSRIIMRCETTANNFLQCKTIHRFYIR